MLKPQKVRLSPGVRTPTLSCTAITGSWFLFCCVFLKAEKLNSFRGRGWSWGGSGVRLFGHDERNYAQFYRFRVRRTEVRE